MPTPEKRVLLDTTVVVRHFRDGASVSDKLSFCDELCLPLIALAELYAGAFCSARPEKNVRQVEAIFPDETTAKHYGEISAQLALVLAHPFRKTTSGLRHWLSNTACQSRPPTNTFDGS